MRGLFQFGLFRNKLFPNKPKKIKGDTRVDIHQSDISASDPRVVSPIPEKRPLLRRVVVYPLLAVLLVIIIVALQFGVDSFSSPQEQTMESSPFGNIGYRDFDSFIGNIVREPMLHFSSDPINQPVDNLLEESSTHNPSRDELQATSYKAVLREETSLGGNTSSSLFFSTTKSAISSEAPTGDSSSYSGSDTFSYDPSLFVDRSSGGASGYISQNMQHQKESFFGNPEENSSIILPSILPQRSTIYPGTVIPIALVTGINTDLPGVVLGRVSSPIYNSSSGEHLLIPAGTTLMGRYDSHISYGQRRVLIVWNFMTRRDGVSLDLGGMPGTDLQGYSGVEGDKVNTHLWKKLGALGLSTLLDLGKHELQYQASQWANGSKEVVSDFGSSVSSGVDQYTSFTMQQQPTITIREGSSLRVIVTAPLMVPPIQESP